jgi:hypothetical protein
MNRPDPGREPSPMAGLAAPIDVANLIAWESRTLEVSATEIRTAYLVWLD